MRRTSIRGVKTAILGALATGLLAIPLGVLLLGADEPPPAEAPETAAAAPQRADRRVRLTPPPPLRRAPPPGARGRVLELRQLPTHRLLALARSDSSERLIAVNLLWARGRHADVEALATKDRVLAAKVRALERARPAK